ncbi:RNA polymerase sigma-70 factor, ECF subfamily [Saccharicrinis carchari]|uniref:RNA polymerase sigma-70 factor, ECF subfamily n=1 Tax=Saccharicrinis carchari TaxID=1168039 RepID=A0A521ACH4_SACCC|nr:RNA polymerase sigma-70 factor [Saccharicrinis carchari]SMO32509.1 RNA polymerase sigma-70 factor, ECF subfamily [Saccharicrinis carchari]
MLVHALIKGNKKAFETVYIDYFDMLFHLALGFIGEHETAHGLVQDTFAKLWECRKELHIKTNLRNYLYTITKNACLNHLRQQEIILRNNRDYLIPEVRYRQEALQSFGDPYSELESLIEKVDEAIDRLPENVRTTFKLNRFESLSYQQIADKLELSPKTVEARISKALKILRKDLKDYLPAVQAVLGFLGL